MLRQTVNNKVTNQHCSCQQKYKCMLVKNEPGIRETTRKSRLVLKGPRCLMHLRWQGTNMGVVKLAKQFIFIVTVLFPLPQ